MEGLRVCIGVTGLQECNSELGIEIEFLKGFG